MKLSSVIIFWISTKPHIITTRKMNLRYYVDGSACILSSVSLLLTIGIHVLYPKMTYYSRALLCHSLNLFIVYVIFSIYDLPLGTGHRLSGLLIVATAYILLISALLWLNVLAFELWRGISQTRCVSSKGRSICMVRFSISIFRRMGIIHFRFVSLFNQETCHLR